MQSLAWAYGIPPEQMAKTLENIVQEGVAELKKAEHGLSWSVMRVKIYKPMEMLQTFHGTNTVSLLKKCILSNDVGVSYSAARTYISIAGADSIPFFRDAIVKGELNGAQRGGLCTLIGGHYIINTDIGYVPYIKKLKENNQFSDLVKFYDFMKEMTQTERDLGVAQHLDHILCDNVDGYKQSVQRQKALERILLLEQEMAEDVKQLILRAEPPKDTL